MCMKGQQIYVTERSLNEMLGFVEDYEKDVSSHAQSS